MTEKEKAYWSGFMTKTDYARVFGPRTLFEPEGIMDIVYSAYGGLINTPADAVEYAHVLMQTKPALAPIPITALQAKEDANIWHVAARMPGQSDRNEILSFSRRTGKLLSGAL